MATIYHKSILLSNQTLIPLEINLIVYLDDGSFFRSWEIVDLQPRLARH